MLLDSDPASSRLNFLFLFLFFSVAAFSHLSQSPYQQLRNAVNGPGMSTPTAAVAVPHYHHTHGHHHSHHHHHGHHHHLSPANPSTTTYFRSTTSNALLHPSSTTAAAPASYSSSSTAARLLPFCQPGNPPTAYASSDGLTPSHQSPAGPPQTGPYLHHRDHAEHPTSTTPRLHNDQNCSVGMTSATTTTTTTTLAAPGMDDPPSRKRRRSREPDWNTFYRNGLPKEIIVIDDTPEPEANTGTSRKTASTITTTRADGSVLTSGVPLYESNAARQPAKRRRRDDAVAATAATTAAATTVPGYHVQYLGSHTHTPLHNATPGGSTRSSDRPNSVQNTTAPTSLSSNSQYDEAPTPLKRKRTTRQQAANEAKRRDIDGFGGALLTYKPPPFPPKKVSDVNVRVVSDVSGATRLSIPDALIPSIVHTLCRAPKISFYPRPLYPV